MWSRSTGCITMHTASGEASLLAAPGGRVSVSLAGMPAGEQLVSLCMGSTAATLQGAACQQLAATCSLADVCKQCPGVFGYDLGSGEAALWCGERCTMHVGPGGQLAAWVTEEEVSAREQAQRKLLEERLLAEQAEAAAAAELERQLLGPQGSVDGEDADGDAESAVVPAAAGDTAPAAGQGEGAGTDMDPQHAGQQAACGTGAAPAACSFVLPVAASVRPRLFVVLPTGAMRMNEHRKLQAPRCTF